MQELAYISFFLMGVILGLLGGGGSILTLPILVYLLQVNPILAIGESFIVVCITSFFGVIHYLKFKLIHWKTVFYFGMASFVTIFFSQTFIVPSIPEIIRFGPGITIPSSSFLMVLFAIVIIFSATAMLRSGKEKVSMEEKQKPKLALFIYGVVVGLLTGILGAGGGFLIVPVLVLLVGLPMKKAIGTSLVIICLNTGFAFLLHLNRDVHINGQSLFYICAFSVVGILLGLQISKRVVGYKLKPAFAILLLAVAVLIIYNEIF